MSPRSEDSTAGRAALEALDGPELADVLVGSYFRRNSVKKNR
ncbi:hypothetical protein WMF30_05905 [Sorangium sp. So ce134]